MNPLEKKPNGDFLEIEKYQKVNQKRLKNKVYKRVKKLKIFIESLILAQDKRWRRTYDMQVERT